MCRVESDPPVELAESGQYDRRWYCCNCGDGPMLFAVTPACTNCGYSLCSSGAYLITPPDSPAGTSSTSGHKGKQPVKPRRIIKSPLSRPPVPSSLPRDTCTTAPAPSQSAPCDEPSEALPDDEESLGAAIERNVAVLAAVLDAVRTATPSANPIVLSALISCAPGYQATAHATKASRQSAPQQQSTKRGRQTSRRKIPDRRQDDDEEDDADEHGPNKRQNTGPEPPDKGPVFRRLACHYCKLNPSRFRHAKSCGNGFATPPDLRGHLTRKDDNPHALRDCGNCLEIFHCKEDRDKHRAGSCEYRELSWPVEGVGSRLRATRQPGAIPELKSGHKASQAEIEEWWKKIWVILFGPYVPFPESIYHDEHENLRRSNDLSSLPDYRDRLERTLKSQVHKKMMEKAFRNHLISLVDAETCLFLGRILDDQTLAREVLYQLTTIVRPKQRQNSQGRRKSDEGVQDSSQGHTDESQVGVNNTAEHANQGPLPEGGQQPYEAISAEFASADAMRVERPSTSGDTREPLDQDLGDQSREVTPAEFPSVDTVDMESLSNSESTTRQPSGPQGGDHLHGHALGDLPSSSFMSGDSQFSFENASRPPDPDIGDWPSEIIPDNRFTLGMNDQPAPNPHFSEPFFPQSDQPYDFNLAWAPWNQRNWEYPGNNPMIANSSAPAAGFSPPSQAITQPVPTSMQEQLPVNELFGLLAPKHYMERSEEEVRLNEVRQNSDRIASRSNNVRGERDILDPCQDPPMSSYGFDLPDYHTQGDSSLMGNMPLTHRDPEVDLTDADFENIGNAWDTVDAD